MTGLQGKRWFFFIWDDFNEHHLSLHFIKTWEAEEVFFNAYVVLLIKRSMGQSDIELTDALTAAAGFELFSKISEILKRAL